MIKEQFWLPTFQDIPSVETKRTSPQPIIENYIPPSPSELNYHPLDLNFRGRLHIWLNDMLINGNFPLNEVLTDTQSQFVSLYLNPQSETNIWLNQDEVSAQVYGDPKIKYFRNSLMRALVRVQRRYAIGERAIEILKPPNISYQKLIESNVHTIDMLERCSSETLQQISTSRPIFMYLKEEMHIHFPDWNPQVTFVSELPPEEASKF
jgi:hypothetical protein